MDNIHENLEKLKHPRRAKMKESLKDISCLSFHDFEVLRSDNLEKDVEEMGDDPEIWIQVAQNRLELRECDE